MKNKRKKIFKVKFAEFEKIAEFIVNLKTDLR